jgi:hypothetical protein
MKPALEHEENCDDADKLNGGSGGARTRQKSNKHTVETGVPSQIASQATVVASPDLSRIVMAWESLPAALKAAILAIVNSSEGIR